LGEETFAGINNFRKHKEFCQYDPILTSHRKIRFKGENFANATKMSEIANDTRKNFYDKVYNTDQRDRPSTFILDIVTQPTTIGLVLLKGKYVQ